MSYRLSSEPIGFLYAFNFMTILTVTPQVIIRKACLEKYNPGICANLSDHKDQQLEVQETSSGWTMLFFLCQTIPSFFTILVLGPLTDVIGRKKGFFFVSISTSVINSIFVINSHFIEASPVYMFFGPFIAGLFGDIAGVIMLCYSHIADITAKKNRTHRMAILEANLFIGLGSGALTSGYLIDAYGFKAVFILNIIIATLMLFYTLCWFKDSVRDKEEGSVRYNLLDDFKDEDIDIDATGGDNGHIDSKPLARKESILKLINPFTHINQVFKVVLKNPRRCEVVCLLIAYFTSMCAIAGEVQILPLYLKNSPFNFTPHFLGYVMGFHGFLACFGALLGGFCSYCLKVSDYKLLLFGLIGVITAFTLTGAARSPMVIILSRIAGTTHPIVATTYRSVVSKFTSAESYGSAIAALESLDVLGQISVNFFGLSIYRASLTIYSGIVFFVLAGLVLVGWFFVAGVAFKVSRSNLSKK